MKKLLIASVIATAAFSAVADETTLYGSVGYNTSLKKNTDWNRSDFYRPGTKFEGDGRYYYLTDRHNTLDLETDELKWGIKGEENISPNLNAFWKLEFGGSSNKMRYAYVGLKGDSWGTFTVGTQDSLVKTVTNYTDIFDKAEFYDNTTMFKDELHRPSKVISYVSPNWSGFQFGIAGILNGQNGTITDNGVGIDENYVTKSETYRYWNPVSQQYENKTVGSRAFGAGQVGLWYNNYGFYAGLAYQYANNDLSSYSPRNSLTDGKFENTYYLDEYDVFGNPIHKDKGTEIFAAAVGYKNDNFKVGLTEKHKSGAGDKIALAGEYYIGPHTIRAGFGLANSNELNESVGKDCVGPYTWHCDSKKVYTYALGYKYNLSKRTYTYVEGIYIDWNAKDEHWIDVDGTAKISHTPIKNHYDIKVGLRHDF